MKHDQTDEQYRTYFHPQGYLAYISTLPFLGSLTCPIKQLEAGSWQELVLDYEVGAAGLADGAWIKITFKFYSDWALFQCDDPQSANYLSAEYQARPLLAGESQATVQALKVRFDQKGHERPFQKAIIVDIVDGYLKPGDHIIVRLGDRRAGGPGTRIQTFVEDGFRFRGYIDPTGTSRFAAIPGDTVIDILPGPPAKMITLAPPLVKTGEIFPLLMRVEDRWGNVCCDLADSLRLEYRREDGEQSNALQIVSQDSQAEKQSVSRAESVEVALPAQGRAVVKQKLTFLSAESITVQGFLQQARLRSEHTFIKAEQHLLSGRPFFADLHVHSNNTIGTNSTEYNFSYGRDVAGLDILGYTANDFHITEASWKKDVELCQEFTSEGDFICYPGTEWCGNSAAGGDHNVIFLGDDVLFPLGSAGQVTRSFEWNEEMKGNALVPGAWPIDKLYEAYIQNAEDVLLIPHVGGRRAILDWHHPKLERLIEVSSSWGHFPWFYQEAMSRGYKLGVSAAGDEHRARSGGGAPGAAVFGVRGGLTGVIAPVLTKASIKDALLKRHTWATTGERVVALLNCGEQIQGDEFEASKTSPLEISYRFVGNAGWDEISAYTEKGLLWQRNMQKEQGLSTQKIRLRWGGARIRDRYRSAEWRGTFTYRNTLVNSYTGSGFEHPEEYVRRSGATEIAFRSDTYGDSDTLEMEVSDLERGTFEVDLHIGSYVKVGNPLTESPYIHCPEMHWQFSGRDLLEKEALTRDLGGTDLFIAVERISENPLPRDIQGSFFLEPREGSHGFVPLYLMGRQVDDAKAWTSPLFITFS
jgi:hypothetical protein